MINPTCNICGQELNDFGALIFGVPVSNKTYKYHICENCFEVRIQPLLIEEVEYPDIDNDF